MSLPRFYTPQLTEGQLELDDEQSRHALQSLRLRVGDELELFDGDGHYATTTLCDTDANKGKGKKKIAQVRVEGINRVPRSKHTLTLYVAGCKGPRLTTLVEKCTELGVDTIAFTEFERSVVKVSESHADKLKRTTIESSKQCGRHWLPKIQPSITFADLVKSQSTSPLLVAHPYGETLGFGVWLKNNLQQASNGIAVVIGPEGGLTDEEVETLIKKGAQPISLGSHILRIETAAIATAATWAAMH